MIRVTGRGLHRHATALVLASILLAGLGLRLYRLGDWPPGLYQDEAFNGLDAVDVIAGARPLYFSANNGREPMYIYLVAMSVAAFGRTAFAERLPAAMLGTLTLAATYAFGRALFNVRWGLLSAAVAASTFWPLALSRIGLRAVGLPLIVALSLACAGLGWRRGQADSRGLGWLALGGALYGLSFYTYLAARFTPLVLIAFLILWYSARRQTFPTSRQIGSFVLPAVLVALPLAVTGLRAPELFFGRAGQVSILNPAINHGDLWGTLFHNLLAAAGMFLWRGDTIARHNLPGRPVFDLVMAVAFLAGTLRAARLVWMRRHLPSALLLIWVGVMLVPTVVAEDTPHFLRSVGVMPAIFLLAAGGLDWVWDGSIAGVRAAGRGLVVAAIAAALALTVRDYFWRYVPAPDTAYLYQAAARDLAQAANAGLDGPAPTGTVAVYVDRRYWDAFPSVRFLMPLRPGLSLYDEGQTLPPAEAASTFLFAWPYEELQAALQVLPGGRLIEAQYGPLHRDDLQPVPYALYAEYSARLDAQARTPIARFEGGFELLALMGTPTTQGGRLELVWRDLQAPQAGYQVFAAAMQGEHVAAQADGPLGSALYPNPWWRPEDRVVERRELALPAGVEWRDVNVRIGLYSLATGARLQRLDTTGEYYEFSPVLRR